MESAAEAESYAEIIADPVRPWSGLAPTVGWMPASNNAGFNSGGAPLSDTGDDDFDRIINVILRGVCNRMKAQLRQITCREAVQSSIGEMAGSKGRSAYSTNDGQ